MIKELLMKYIALSDAVRPGYSGSLGQANQEWEMAFSAITPVIPVFFREIYCRWEGTKREMENQPYMDFIPGYRLIHIGELAQEYHALLENLELDDVCEAEIESIIPILADDASCYICYVKTRRNQEAVFSYSPEEGLERMHDSVEAFLKTIIAFYEEKVYFKDEDGFLDYDFDREGTVGAAWNPGIEYWIG
ncbi:MAG: SMI1/KNR4 family protein [Roseburia sp.]|nr:SMI1/KNR4 family protein [Roseburia sp.]